MSTDAHATVYTSKKAKHSDMTKPAINAQDAHIFLDLFDHTADRALLIWKEEPGWPIVYASKGFYDMLALDEQSSPLNLFSLIHPDDQQECQRHINAILKESQTFVHHGEYRLISNSGKFHWVQDKTLPLDNFAGERGNFFACNLSDVTERKQIEQDLEDKRKRLELVLEGTRLGLWDWNPQTNAVVFNERWASMLGYPFNEIEHNLATWESKVHPDDLADCYADITAHMEGKVDFYENVHRMRHKDGSWRYILDRGKIVDKDSEGNATRFTGTHTDITPQKQAELKAKQAANAKAQFLANMSHEIRTPLHGMLGLLSLINQNDLSERDQILYQTVQSSAKLLKEIINDILDFSKLDANRISLNCKPTALTFLIQQSIGLYQVMAQEKGLTITTDSKNLSHDIYDIDSLRLSQCINNLLSNAIKFTHDGQISISISNSDQHVSIAISDTGIGIANIEKVFELFHQEGDLNFIQGTGLGLSITKQLVELMKGEIQIESELGKGTTFTLLLPLIQREQAEYSTEAYCQLQPQEKNILVAEDNGINQLVISEMLQELGQRFTLTKNGEEAVKALENQSFDLLFLDLHMPKLDGKGVIQALDEKNIDIPIIMMSADVFNTEDSEKVIASLTKPFEKQALQSLLLQIQNKKCN